MNIHLKFTQKLNTAKRAHGVYMEKIRPSSVSPHQWHPLYATEAVHTLGYTHTSSNSSNTSNTLVVVVALTPQPRSDTEWEGLSGPLTTDCPQLLLLHCVYHQISTWPIISAIFLCSSVFVFVFVFVFYQCHQLPPASASVYVYRQISTWPHIFCSLHLHSHFSSQISFPHTFWMSVLFHQI